MEVIVNSFKNNRNFDKHFDRNNSCFFDIETTGLSRKYHIIYLVGILYFDPSKDLWNLVQIFGKIEEEGLILKKLISILDKFDTLITYNGASFDIPFVNNRLKHHNIDYEISKSKSMDIYRIIRANRQYLNLENMKLKTIEESLGIYREDIYSGKDCIGFYYDYLRSEDLDLKRKILQHNYDDLFYMLDTMEILDILHDKKSIDLFFKESKLRATIKNIVSDKDILSIDGFLDSSQKHKLRYFAGSFTFKTFDNNSFILNIETEKGYVSPEKECLYIEKDILFNPDEIWDINNHYPVPSDFLVLSVKKDYFIHNIKIILENILLNLL